MPLHANGDLDMTKKLSVMLALAAALIPAGLMGQGFTGLSFNSAVMNKYIWRGIVVTDESVIQPSISAGYGKLSFNVWGNVDLSDGQNYDVDLSEVDYTLDYSATLGIAGFTAGAIYYTFPNTGFDATIEIYAGLSLSSPLNPSATFYQDIHVSDGAYLLLSIAPSIPLDAWSSSLDLTLSLGIGSGNNNSFYYGSSGGAVSDFLLGLSMPFNLSDRTSLTPSIAFINLVDNGIRAAQACDDNILVGLGFSTSF